MKQNSKADVAPAQVSDDLVKEVLHLVAATTATEPQIPQAARKRLQDKVKATFAPAECGQHTPTRWDWSDLQAILNNAGEHLRDSSPASSERCFEAAKRLTQLKTAHDQLVTALQAMVNLWPAKAHQANPQHPIHQARAALAQAQKGAL